MLAPMEAVRRLLALRHRGRTEDLPAVLLQAAPLLDAESAGVLLIDYGQQTLCPLHGTVPGAAEPQQIEGTAAGLAFATGGETWEEDHGRLWLPLLHGAERLGVLELRVKAYPPEAVRRDLEVIAALVAELIASRRFYGDAVEHTRRRLPMQLAAEIIWNQLPPLTCAVDGTVVTAVLEPCYDVGGDAFDYAANDDILHVALFDTVGHGISAGHPAELLLRGGRQMPALPTPTALPLGLGHMLGRPPAVSEAQLEPGDTLVLYTDGITEARDVTGALFGPDRLAEFLLRALAKGTPAPEIMRRLIHTIISYEEGELRDDATAAMLQWRH